MTKEGAQHGEVRIRATVPGDVPRVWELLHGLAAYEELTAFVTGDADRLHEALFGSGERLRGLVAERDGRLIGYALYFPVFRSFRTRWRLWLEDLFVDPQERGSGAGVALMAELARLAIDGGYDGLDWEVLDWNEPALAFYQRLGGVRTCADLMHYRLEGAALVDLARSATRRG